MIVILCFNSPKGRYLIKHGTRNGGYVSGTDYVSIPLREGTLSNTHLMLLWIFSSLECFNSPKGRYLIKLVPIIYYLVNLCTVSIPLREGTLSNAVVNAGPFICLTGFNSPKGRYLIKPERSDFDHLIVAGGFQFP